MPNLANPVWACTPKPAIMMRWMHLSGGTLSKTEDILVHNIGWVVREIPS